MSRRPFLAALVVTLCMINVPIAFYLLVHGHVVPAGSAALLSIVATVLATAERISPEQ